MDISSVKAELKLSERGALDAHYQAMCHGTAVESRAKALAWRDAKSALVAGHE
jgi:hypothetical protein